jgi:DNA-binding GntR family transcriptional regulator
MPTKKHTLLTPRERAERLQTALARLIGNDAFQDFVEGLREIQRNTLLDLMNDTVVKDERLTAAALGEIRAYEAIINLCDDHIQTRLAEADAEQVE